MADEEEGRLRLAAGVGDQGQGLAGVAAIEVACGLVGEDQPGAVGQGPGHGDPLLLAGGELSREVIQAVCETDPPQQATGADRAGAIGSEAHPEKDVLQHRVALEQVEGLEDDPDVPGPNPVPLRLRQGDDVHAIDLDRAAVGREDACNQVQEGGLSRAAFAAQGALLPGGKPKLRNINHQAARSLRGGIVLLQITNREHRVPVSAAARQDAKRFRRRCNRVTASSRRKESASNTAAKTWACS